MVAEWLAAITALVLVLYKKSLFNKSLLLFLCITIGVEGYGSYLMLHKIPNAFLYNLFGLVQIVFYSWVISKAAPRPFNVKLVLVFLGFYLLFGIYNMLFGQGLTRYNSYTVTFGTFLILTGCFLSVKYWLEADGGIRKYIRPYLILVIGISIFKVGTFCYVQVIQYIIKNHLDTDRKLFNSLYGILNVILYSCFIVALIIDANSNRKKESFITSIDFVAPDA